MTERPILFSGPMVRAILDGRKTQTRRVIKPQPDIVDDTYSEGVFALWSDDHYGPEGFWTAQEKESPYGRPGDRLWVRETWGVGTRPHPFEGWVDGIEYRADEAYIDEIEDLPLWFPDAPDGFYENYNKEGWRPSIHMPRWACRLLLDVKVVRVKRLHEISECDAIAEGMNPSETLPCGGRSHDPVQDFLELWDSLNAKRGHGWDTNPWVWVIEFSVVQGGRDG